MKNFFLAEEQIQELTEEPKRMKASADDLLRGARVRGVRVKKNSNDAHSQNTLKFPRAGGGKWHIYLRQSKDNALDFSCGLGIIPKGRAQVFTLRRYNGKSHPHTNRLENEAAFYDFHIHQATERYQQSRYGDEHYARPTDRYADLRGAVLCLLQDFRVESAGGASQQTLL